MPERLPEPHYGPDAAVRRVRQNGEIKWRGDVAFISSALIGQTAGPEETEGGGWLVRFCDVPLGAIHLDQRKLRRPDMVRRSKAPQNRIEP